MLLLAFAILLLSSCSSPEKDKQEYYHHAMDLVKQDKREAAILELRSAIQIDAKFADARYQLGLLYLKGGEGQKAFGELLRAADLDPDNLDANLKVAQIYFMAKKNEESRKRLNQVLTKDPNNRDALTLLANLELVEKNYSASLAALGKIGEAVEKSDTLLNIKGRIYAAQDQWNEAEAAFRKAIAVNASNFNNYEPLLMLFDKKKNLNEAKKVLDELLEKFPNEAKSHLLLAGYYLHTNEHAKVAGELKEVIRIAPDNPRFRLQLADFYEKNSEPAKAEETLLTAHKDIGDNPEITTTLATHYFEQKQFDRAQSLLDELTATQPGYGGTKLLKARFLLKDGNARDAETILQALNTDFPSWAAPKFYLGLAYYSLGEIELAQKAVTEAIQKNNQKSEYHGLLAQIYQVQGSFEDAKRESAIALQLNSNNFQAALILTRSLIYEKEYLPAIKILTSMRQQLPDNQGILANLTMAYLGNNEQLKAEESLKDILRIDPGNPRAVAMLITMKFKGNLPGAESFVRQQINNAKADARLYLILGNLLEGQKNDQEALAAYEKAQELDPSLSPPYLAAARLLTKLGQKDEALAKYKTMVEKLPNSLTGHMGMAALFQIEGDNNKAIEQYRKVLDIKKDYTPAANNLAWLIASDPNGDLGEALMLAMRARQESPDDPNVADTLGWVHYQRNSFSLAIAQFEFALRSHPDNPTWVYHLALAQKGDKKEEAAIQTLKKLLEKKTEFSDRTNAEELLAELTK